jgi:hypothetical protein
LEKCDPSAPPSIVVPAFAKTICGDPVALLSHSTAISRFSRVTLDSRPATNGMMHEELAPFGIYTLVCFERAVRSAA